MAETTTRAGRTTQTRPRRTRTADVRAALVDAAAAVLERDGAAGLTVRAVAAEAQVAPMGVYNHLDGKAGLLVAVLQRGFDGLRAAITPDASVPAGQRLAASGFGYRRFALANPNTYGLMFTASEVDENSDAIAPHALPAFGALVELVGEGQRSGSVRPGAPEAIALQIWSSVHGAMSLELADRLVAGAEPESAYADLVAMVLRGVAPDN